VDTELIKNKNYYDLSSQEDYKKYQIKQKEMWKTKWYKTRAPFEYLLVSTTIGKLKAVKHRHVEMICLGARNNFERDAFKSFLATIGHNIDVYSLDIADEADVDYCYDFEKLPEYWEDRFDIIYTNAADHSFNFHNCLKEWNRVLKNDGLLILGIADQDMLDDEIEGEPAEVIGVTQPGAHGCTIFDKQSVDLMCSEYFDSVNFVKSKKHIIEMGDEIYEYHLQYNYWFCVKKKNKNQE
tara:strand:- start:126 stop:842 length:717 start_codon:yes stop_codon:yes gene_type:complete